MSSIPPTSAQMQSIARIVDQSACHDKVKASCRMLCEALENDARVGWRDMVLHRMHHARGFGSKVVGLAFAHPAQSTHDDACRLLLLWVQKSDCQPRHVFDVDMLSQCAVHLEPRRPCEQARWACSVVCAYLSKSAGDRRVLNAMVQNVFCKLIDMLACDLSEGRVPVDTKRLAIHCLAHAIVCGTDRLQYVLAVEWNCMQHLRLALFNFDDATNQSNQTEPTCDLLVLTAYYSLCAHPRIVEHVYLPSSTYDGLYHLATGRHSGVSHATRNMAATILCTHDGELFGTSSESSDDSSTLFSFASSESPFAIEPSVSVIL